MQISLQRLVQGILRNPEDHRGWLELADGLRRSAALPGLDQLGSVLPYFPAACAANPRDRTLVETFFPRLGLEFLSPQERPPGSFSPPRGGRVGVRLPWGQVPRGSPRRALG